MASSPLFPSVGRGRERERHCSFIDEGGTEVNGFIVCVAHQLFRLFVYVYVFSKREREDVRNKTEREREAGPLSATGYFFFTHTHTHIAYFQCKQDSEHRARRHRHTYSPSSPISKKKGGRRERVREFSQRKCTRSSSRSWKPLSALRTGMSFYPLLIHSSFAGHPTHTFSLLLLGRKRSAPPSFYGLGRQRETKKEVHRERERERKG